MFDKYTIKKAPNDNFQKTIYAMSIAKNRLLNEQNSSVKTENERVKS